MFSVDENFLLSQNFKLSEFRCKDGSKYVTVSYRLINKLQAMRDSIKRPIVIISGYRTASYNIECGGAKESQHLIGNAADIQIAGMTPEQMYAFAKTFHFSGIGLYDSFIHVDVRPIGTWDGDERKQNKGREIPTYTGGTP